MLLSIFKRVTFWLGIISLLMCFNDIWGTLHSPTIFMAGLGPFEPFRYWMLKFDRFDHAIESVSIEAKVPGYIVHFITFILVGIVMDGWIAKLRKRITKN